MADQNVQSIYRTLVEKIASVRRRELWYNCLSDSIFTLTGLLAVWIAATALEYLFEFGTQGRAVLFWSAIGLSGVIVALRFLPSLARITGILPSQDDLQIARRVGFRIPTVRDRLVNVLQLYRTTMEGQPGSAALSGSLAGATIAGEGPSLAEHDYSVIIDRDERKRGLLLLFSALVVFGSLAFTLGDGLSAAFERLTHYSTHYQKPAPFTLDIAPGSTTVTKGDSLDIIVSARGVPPLSVQLSIQEEGQQTPDTYDLREDSTGTYRFTIPNVRSSLSYFASAATVETERHAITVVERPEISEFSVRVTPPAYTGRPPETLPEGYGDVQGLKGTRVSISATTTMNVDSAVIVQLYPRASASASDELPETDRADVAERVVEEAGTQSAGPSGRSVSAEVRYDTVRIPMSVDGTRLSGSFSLRTDGEYYVHTVSEDGLTNPSPIRYRMLVTQDGDPSIALQQPRGQVDIGDEMQLPIQVSISDDYGFSRLRIMYRLTASRYEEAWTEFKSTSIPLPRTRSDGRAAQVPHLWDLTSSRMVPEDELEFYVEVSDNDVVSGPKSARTPTVNVRFPSFDEMLREADEIERKATANIDKLLDQAEKARRDMEDLDRELTKQLAQNKSEAGWQEQEKLKDIIKKHEAAQREIEKIAENMRTMTEKMQEAKAITPETLEKYEELQKLFEELKSPELMESMRKLQEEMDKMSPNDLVEAMKQYEFNEEQFRQSIERTKKILEKMMRQKDVDELARRAEKLASDQSKLAEQMERSQDQNVRNQLAERQEQLAKQTSELQQKASDLSERMGEESEKTRSSMENASQQLQQQNPSSQMQQSASAMKQGNREKVNQNSRQAQKSLSDFAKEMQKVRKQMQESERRQVLNKMKRSLKDLLELSKEQEALTEKTESTPASSPEFRDLAKEQQQLQKSMRNVANQMMEAGQESFAVTPEMGREMGEAMQQMAGAQQAMEERNGYKASQQGEGAMGSMNSSAMMMSQAISQLESQGGQGMGAGMGMGSFRERLGQIASQQQMINMAMQQQGQGGQGGQGEGQKSKQGKNGKGQKEGDGSSGSGGQGGSQNGGQDGVSQRLTQQQEQVKKSLDQLNKEAREHGGTRKNRLGDLERAAKEIEEVLTDMQSGNISEETLRRQEQILSRMLDAMKSQRERDFEKRRESRPGQDIVRESPPGLDRPEDRTLLDRIRQELESGEVGYSRDYEYLIRRYFDALGSP